MRPHVVGFKRPLTAGHLPFKGIIHVAGINMFWRATENSIRKSVNNAMKIVKENNFHSVAFPLIGAGTGSFNRDRVIEIMSEQLSQINFSVEVLIVKFEQNKENRVKS